MELFLGGRPFASRRIGAAPPIPGRSPRAASTIGRCGHAPDRDRDQAARALQHKSRRAEPVSRTSAMASIAWLGLPVTR
jgi:hypothetical protein